jgi:hypothetical protein
MEGRPHGKLLPRYAGPIAQFLLTHPKASRADLIDFVARTFGVRVSRIALYKFLKKFGLDQATLRDRASGLTPRVVGDAPAASLAGATDAATPTPAPAPLPPPTTVLPPPAPFASQGQPVPVPAPPFSAHARSTPAPSC